VVTRIYRFSKPSDILYTWDYTFLGGTEISPPAGRLWNLPPPGPVFPMLVRNNVLRTVDVFYDSTRLPVPISTKVVTPICNESARSAALCELVVRLVNDSLTEYSYAAYVAELQYGLKATDAGFQVRFSYHILRMFV